MSTLVLLKINEDNFNQSDYYGAPFCERQYTHGSCTVYLFVQIQIITLIPPPPPPRIASIFRHLLSCGTIEAYRGCFCQSAQPCDFVMKMKQNSSQSYLTSLSSFAGPSYLTIRSSCLHYFNLRSLYFQSLPSLSNWIQIDTS